MSRPLLILLVCLLSAGCGLVAYEEKLKEAQENLQAFEDEDRLLGEPIDYSEKDKEGPPLFLRLPKGIQTKGQREPFSTEVYFHYKRDPREGGDCPFLEVLVAGVAPAADRQTELRTEKMPARTDNLAAKVLERFGLREATNFVLPRGIGRSALKAQSFTKDQPSYSVAGYLDKEDDNQVAVIFYLDKARKDDTAEKLMKTTLRSLAVGADTTRARNAYEQRHRHPGSATAPARR